ncbi:MAG TPA: PLP-dependent aminotransferase family protein [Burkholderiales bacterium]|nr:PLP-dependent aminotransferase family protein [Burkholderiales bacterium]
MMVNLRGPGPLYRRIYHALKADISAGRLAPQSRLPSTRALAADLGVSRNTVTLAYEQLVAEGYVHSRDRSTTRVAGAASHRNAPARAMPPKGEPALSAYARRLVADPAMPPAGSYAERPGIRHDFRYGRPSMDAFPRQVWRRLLAAHAGAAPVGAFGYAAPAGHAPLRDALAGYLRRARGMTCEADQIVIVNGTQQALDLASRLLVDAGDRVVIEEPHYHSVRLSFEAVGAKLVPIEVDDRGLDPSRLPRAGARVACVTPCHQFPTGVVMPMTRRLELLDWAARTGTWIIEDDYVSEFRYEGHPIEALHALDRAARVIYMGTFSKTLFPALRVAYLVLPHALVGPFTAAKWMADRYTATLGQEALADFITQGHFERYLRRAGARNAAKRRVLIEALRECFGDRVEIAGENAGVHLLVWLKDVEARKSATLVERASRAGVGIYPVDLYYSKPPRRAGFLFGYASLTESGIRAGIRKLAAVV